MRRAPVIPLLSLRSRRGSPRPVAHPDPVHTFSNQNFVDDEYQAYAWFSFEGFRLPIPCLHPSLLLVISAGVFDPPGSEIVPCQPGFTGWRFGIPSFQSPTTIVAVIR